MLVLLSGLFQSGSLCSFSCGKFLYLFQWWFLPFCFLPSLFLGLLFECWVSWTSPSILLSFLFSSCLLPYFLQIYSTLVFIFCGYSIFSSFWAYRWWLSEPFSFLNILFSPCYLFFCLFWSFMLEAFLRCLLLLVRDLEYETKEVGWKFWDYESDLLTLSSIGWLDLDRFLVNHNVSSFRLLLVVVQDPQRKIFQFSAEIQKSGCWLTRNWVGRG